MKITHGALAVLCGCALLASPTWAQTLRQPASMRPASVSKDNADFGYRYYDSQEEASPSDAAAVPAAAEPAAQDPVAMVANPCDSCGVPASSCGCDSCYRFGSDEPFKLFSGDNGLGINAGFWSQVGYHTQGNNVGRITPWGTDAAGDGLMNNYPNRVQLQQQWFYLEKAVDTGGCGFDWGFRADFVYGTDGPNTQAFGGPLGTWDYGWNNGGAYGSAIPQLYAELGYNDLKAKIGHFYTIEGFEVIPATGNFFYSHSFEFYISEPFTHTGVLFEQKVNDAVTVLGGWTAGWDTGFSRNGGSDFLGGVKLQLTEKASLFYQVSLGNAGFNQGGVPGSDQNGYFHTLLFNWNLTDNWTYVCQSNLVDNDILLGDNQDALSLNNYLFYKFNECWAVGTRLEWFKDPRVSAIPGTTGEVVDLTVGLNYRPAANVVIRPELRWDDFEANSGLQDNFLFGIDTVITY